jgi:hypothetical protein
MSLTTRTLSRVLTLSRWPKAHATQQQADRGHDHVIDQGFDDGAERPANDHAYGQIHYVSTHDERFEFLEHLSSPFSL